MVRTVDYGFVKITRWLCYLILPNMFISVCVVKRKLSLFSHCPQSEEDREEENKGAYNKRWKKVLPMYMHGKAP